MRCFPLGSTTAIRQVRAYLAWQSYLDAAWSCEAGFSEGAHERFALLERLVPNDERFRELRQHCP